MPQSYLGILEAKSSIPSLVARTIHLESNGVFKIRRRKRRFKNKNNGT